MLEGILGRGFSSKCKPLLKSTKTRIDVIRRKRKATEKFLKKDIADLLANRHDANAYGRADGLLAELILSSCYDFVEHLCDLVLKSLSVMQKERECPEDCREAVSSLMFAAARFSDLPELRDLRQIFQERYGNALELCVNQKFVENLASKPSTLENKVQLMQDIALEFSIMWDSRAFEKRMSKTSTYSQQDKPKVYGSANDTGDKNKSSSGMGTLPRGEKPDVSSDERLGLANRHRLYNGQGETVSKREELCIRSRHELSDKGYQASNGGEGTILKKDGRDISSPGGQKIADDKHEAWNRKGDATPKSVRSGSSSRGKGLECIDDGSGLPTVRGTSIPESDCPGSLLHGKPEIGKEPLGDNNRAIRHDVAYTVRNVEKDTTLKGKAYYSNGIPPPYVKPNVKPKGSKSVPNGGSSLAGYDNKVAPEKLSTPRKSNHSNVAEKIQLGFDHSDYERPIVGLASANSNGQEKDNFYQDDVTGNLSKSRSVRHRRSKSRHKYNDADHCEDMGGVRRKSRSKARDNSRRGLQILFDGERYEHDEEERKLDKLLMKYSMKPSSYEQGIVRRKDRAHHAPNMGNDAGELPQNSADGLDEKPQMVPPPPRSVSLPHDHTGQSQTTKVFSRAASFQPDRSSVARHVHPKLPDYDDLAARFAALRGS